MHKRNAQHMNVTRVVDAAVKYLLYTTISILAISLGRRYKRKCIGKDHPH